MRERGRERERERERERVGVLSPINHCGLYRGLVDFHKEIWLKGLNKAKIRREEQVKKTENCREELWNQIQLKGP